MIKFLHAVLENLLWLVNKVPQREWLWVLVYLGAGVVILRFVDPLLKQAITHWLKKFSAALHAKIFAAARGPVRLLIVVYFASMAFDSFKAMPPALWDRVQNGFVPLIYQFSLLVVAYRLVEIIAHLLREHWAGGESKLDERWADLFGKVGKTLVIVITVLAVLSHFTSIWPYLTGASFLGAAVALASQKTIANIIGSLEIMFGRLFKEGDRISFGEYDGFVTQMGLRCIELTSLTGEKINLPNKDLVEQQIRNYSHNKLVRTMLSIGITYDNNRSEIERALALLSESIKANPKVNRVTVTFQNFGNSSLELEAIFWADYKTALEYKTLINELNLNIKEKFDAEGIEFAFPTQTIYVKSEPKS